MSRWEYKTDQIKQDKNMEGKLNDLGEEGWEVVSSSPAIVAGNTPGLMFVVLKRQKQTVSV